MLLVLFYDQFKTEVLAPELASLCSHGIFTVEYLDDILLREQLAQSVLDNVVLNVQKWQFKCILNLQKFVLTLTSCLAYLGLVLDTAHARGFLPGRTLVI